MSALKMAKNIFRKHAGVSRDEAARIVEGLPESWASELCQSRPDDAREAVQRAYSKYLQAAGDAAKASEIKEITPALAEEGNDQGQPGIVAVDTSAAPGVAEQADNEGAGYAERTEDLNEGLG